MLSQPQRSEPRLHLGGLRGQAEVWIARSHVCTSVDCAGICEGQHREVPQPNDRVRESSEVVVIEVQFRQARQLTDRFRESSELVVMRESVSKPVS